MHEQAMTRRGTHGGRGQPCPAGAARSGPWRRWLACVALMSGCCPPGDIEACLAAEDRSDSSTTELCERAWHGSEAESVAVAGARHALTRRDDASLQRWVRRAHSTIEGARILHYWGERQRAIGDLEGSEATLRQTLKIRVDRDPARATNTALALLELVQSKQPAEESIWLARLAWEQAERAGEPLSRAFAAEALAGILIELGELGAANAVIQRMNRDDSPVLKDVAEGRLRAAQGRRELAAALFERASDPAAHDPGRSWPLNSRIALVHALLDVGRIGDARTALDKTIAIAKNKGTGAVNTACRLAAAEGAVLLAEGKIDAALASVARGLATSSRDAALVQLRNVHGDALARRGDFDGAEQTWRAAADSVESWRASIPSYQLRAELVGHHRHALESWLDSTASRGNVAGALEVTSRVVGRALLDRIHEREAADAAGAGEEPPATGSGATATASADADASIDEAVRRLAANRDVATTPLVPANLLHVPYDMVAVMFGAHWTWAIRRVRGTWSIDRVGDRTSVIEQIDAYRSSVDDPAIAAKLGEAVFPLHTLPTGGAPLVVLLDRELADVALPGLRVGGKFLVEHAPILELLAPELVFIAVPTRTWSRPVVIGNPKGDLKRAAREAIVVARALKTEPHIGQAATRNVLANAGRARVMHVATHSTIRMKEAALVLSDGALSSLEIVRRRIAPRVAVIATCRSQVADDPATSLVAAFLAAGAAGVIGVKRALDDDEGATLMLEFYRAGGADHPLQALARAQRSAIASHRPPHAWATVSFFGVGGWILTQE